MDPGVNGVIGDPVVLPVVRLESRSAHEPAPILPRPTVDWTARDLGKKRVNATLKLVQVNWFVSSRRQCVFLG